MTRNYSMLVFAAAGLGSRGARVTEASKSTKAIVPVPYPLPPLPLPAVQPEGKWAETEDSPARRVSRAWVKLGQAAGIERSDATRRLHQAWKSEVGQSGPPSRAAQAAHARFLAAYKHDLEQARAIYDGVLRDVDAMDGEGAQSGSGDPAARSLAREADDQFRAADRDDRRSNSACFLSPETCQQSDPSDKALQDEIAVLVKGTLVEGGPDGGLSLYALRRKAGLLALRARGMAPVTQRPAARLATEGAPPPHGQGPPRTLPSPGPPAATPPRSPAPNPAPY